MVWVSLVAQQVVGRECVGNTLDALACQAEASGKLSYRLAAYRGCGKHLPARRGLAGTSCEDFAALPKLSSQLVDIGDKQGEALCGGRAAII